MRKSTRSLIIGLSFALGSLTVCLGAIEVAFRVFWPQENLYIYELRQNFLFHRAGFEGWAATVPKLSWNELQRSLQKLPPANEGPFKARLRFDENGFLSNHRTTLEKTPGRKRLLILGDSISLGWPEGTEGGYVGDLKRNLDLDVVNCSLIGTNTVGLADIYEKYCSRFDADAVLLQITVTAARSIPDYFWADFMGPAARMEDAVWQKSSRSVATLNRPLADTLDFNVHIDLGAPAIRREVETIYRPFTPFYDFSNLVRLIENSFFLEPLTHSPVINEISEALQKPEIEAVLLKNLARGEHPTLRAAERIRKLAEQKGQRVLIAVIANRYGAETERFARTDYTPLLQGLGNLGMTVIDLATEWRARRIDDLYWKEDPHPNRNGYREIAGRLRPELERLLSAR